MQAFLECLPNGDTGNARFKKNSINRKVKGLVVGHREAPLLARGLMLDEVIEEGWVQLKKVNSLDPIFRAPPKHREEGSKVVVLIKKVKNFGLRTKP